MEKGQKLEFLTKAVLPMFANFLKNTKISNFLPKWSYLCLATSCGTITTFFPKQYLIETTSFRTNIVSDTSCYIRPPHWRKITAEICHHKRPVFGTKVVQSFFANYRLSDKSRTIVVLQVTCSLLCTLNQILFSKQRWYKDRRGRDEMWFFQGGSTIWRVCRSLRCFKTCLKVWKILSGVRGVGVSA